MEAAEAEERAKAAEKAAAEEAARAEQERLIVEAARAEQEAQRAAEEETARQSEAEQQAQQAEAAQRAAEEEVAQQSEDAEEAAQQEADSAAEEQYAEEDASAVEEQYEEPAAPDPSVTSSDPRLQAILDNPSINLTTMVQQDLVSGMVDPLVLDVVEFAAREHTISISVFATGHPFGPTLDGLGYAGYPNAHYFGRAVDIYEVDGAAVTSGNAAARSLAQAIFDNFAPAELGSPWTFGAGSFADALHQDHIHVGWAYGSDGSL